MIILCAVLIQVVYTNVSAQYYSAYDGNNPVQYTQRVLYGIEQLGTSVSSNVAQSSTTALTWTGTTYLALSASANATGEYLPSSCLTLCTIWQVVFLQPAAYLYCMQSLLGIAELLRYHAGSSTFNLTITDSTATCVTTPVATSSGSKFPWWAGLLLGLGLALILALALCGCLLWFIKRKLSRKATYATHSLRQGSNHGMQPVANPMQTVSPFNVVAANGQMQTPDDSAMIVPKFSSAPEDGVRKSALGLARAGTSSAPPDVYEANMKIGAPANVSSASDTSNGIISGQNRRQSSGNERNSAASAGSNASQRMGRNSAGAAASSVPELFRQRSQMPLDEVELGPLLGRGAYGRVFKGAQLLTKTLSMIVLCCSSVYASEVAHVAATSAATTWNPQHQRV